ncbi:MAG: PilZ domain-containing protein [Gammaproteobacteria bacterium]
MFNVNEKRNFPRLRVNSALTYSEVQSSDKRTGIVNDLSGNGINFVANEPIVIGTLLDIHVDAGTEATPPLDAIIEVVRSDPTETEGQFIIGGLIKSFQ